MSGQSQAPDIPSNEFAFTGLAGHTNYQMAILRVNATISPRMDLYFFGQEANLAAVNGGSVSDPASSPAALAVGAYDVDNPGPIEPFSSDGPTIDGRLKPDIAAP